MTPEGANWNMAQQYYEILQAFMSFETQAYAENDIRELWKWVSWLYDSIYIALGEEERQKLDQEYEIIEKDIYESSEGDKLSDLYSDGSSDDVEEYRRQMKLIRRFRRRILDKMQEKGMLLPWEKGRPMSQKALELE